VSPTFRGRRVALLEARHSDTAAALVERMGGVPVSAPALSEAPTDAGPEVRGLVDALGRDEVACVVVLTGVAASKLFQRAGELGLVSTLIDSLGRATLIARGPKAAAALATMGLKPTLTAAHPFTTHEVADALASVDVTGRGVAILHYGQRNPQLSAALAERGARVMDVLLYDWRLPRDTGPLERLVDALLSDSIDAVAFTSQIQARHLFAVAGPTRSEALRRALNRHVVGAIGPVCADVLVELGVPPTVVPSQHKLQPLLAGMAEALNRPL
jgi:uroporphyrinogen-III synthase